MDFGINAKDILGIKVRFIVPTVSDIPSRGNVGDLCFIADSNIIYIAGMTGWFGYGFDNYIEFPTEESGTVLFDGVTTLDEDGHATIELAEALVEGYTITVTYDGNDYTGTVVEHGGSNAVNIETDTITIIIFANGSNGSLAMSNDGEAITGEINIKIVQSES